MDLDTQNTYAILACALLINVLIALSTWVVVSKQSHSLKCYEQEVTQLRRQLVTLRATVSLLYDQIAIDIMLKNTDSL